jgi:hypothetical protein
MGQYLRVSDVYWGHAWAEKGGSGESHGNESLHPPNQPGWKHVQNYSRVSSETSFVSKQLKLEPKLVSALSETRRLFRLFRFNIETGSFGVSKQPKQTKDQPKLFRTLGRECAGTLGEGTPFWGWGAPGPQWGTVSVSWVWTGEERRRSEMAENEEDSSTTASRNDHAQSKCHCASVNNSVTYPS